MATNVSQSHPFLKKKTSELHHEQTFENFTQSIFCIHLLFLQSDLHVRNVFDFTTAKSSETVGFNLFTGVKTANSGN